MPKELLVSGRMTQATDIYSFGLMSEWCCSPVCGAMRLVLCEMSECDPDALTDKLGQWSVEPSMT